MNHLQKIVAAAVACVLLCTAGGAASFEASAASFITDQTTANGSMYTGSLELAAALDEVFAGDVDLFRDAAATKERLAPLGTSYLGGGSLYWVQNEQTGETISGWQCYIYANAVYNKLFGEWIRHGDEQYDHSVTVLSGGQREVSFSMFVEAGVRCGAYMRTTANSDGSYNSSAAHSLIILSYTPKSVTYLDGNSDGNGLVRVNTRTWAEFNATNLSGHGRRVAHVIQPTEAYYDEHYPVIKHDPSHVAVGGNGDVSGNDEVDVRDYMMLKRYVLQTVALTECQLAAADVNGDDSVDARDYMMLKLMVLGRLKYSK